MAGRLVIIGGSAGGATAAARARRIDENADIILLERSPFVSYANCGIPYYIGNVIKDRDSLFIHTPESLKKNLNIDVRTNHEAIKLIPDEKKIFVRNLESDKEYNLDYDKLILAPGAEALKPPLQGADSRRVFTLKTINDMDSVIAHLQNSRARSAAVIGGGFIGVEAAENLRLRGIDVTLIELEKHILPPLDAEMASPLHKHLRHNGVDLRLGRKVVGIDESDGNILIRLADGDSVQAHIVVLCVGIRSESRLAQEAGLALNPRGAIVVDKLMRTSDPDIFAVGDAVETFDRISLTPTLSPLAGAANRQARIAAENAMADSPSSEYRGSLGTWIVKIFDMTAAQCGLSEKRLKILKKAYSKVYVHPLNHAGYYPGASPMTIKLLFSPGNGTLLGAQIIGREGVDKRIDVLATAISGKMSTQDLVHIDFAYAPPYGSAKDPVNQAGMAAENIRLGFCKAVQPDELSDIDPQKYMLIDVRTPAEHKTSHIPGSKLIPLYEIRKRSKELPKDKRIIVYCQAGLRGYFAQRILIGKGYDAWNLVGGLKAWSLYNDDTKRDSV